jgi:hypothetical protein
VESFVSLLAVEPSTTTSAGTSVSGTLAALESALNSILSKSTTTTLPSTPGTYSVTVKSSGARATGADVVVTLPSGTYGTTTIGNVVVHAVATFAHQNVAVIAPSNPLVITPAFLKQLGSNGAGILGGSLG